MGQDLFLEEHVCSQHHSALGTSERLFDLFARETEAHELLNGIRMRGPAVKKGDENENDARGISEELECRDMHIEREGERGME